MGKISTKTIARIASVQALYEYEINKPVSNIESIVAQIIRNYSGDDFKSVFEIPAGIKVKLHENYMRELVMHTFENLNKIDEIITSHLAAGWNYDSMHIALAAILRVAIGELLYYPEVPYKVIINEFTTLASEIVKESEVAFVNSLLDNVRVEYRKADA